MVTKRLVKNIAPQVEADAPENRQIAEWLKKLRGESGQKEFYKNIAVDQQTGSNYERANSKIPAWVAVRAMRRYGSRDDIRWWMNFILEPAVTPEDEATSTAAQLLSVEHFEQWAAGTEAYQALSPERAQKLHRFVAQSVELFARGLIEAEDQLVNQVKVINELASKSFSAVPDTAANQPSPTDANRRDPDKAR